MKDKSKVIAISLAIITIIVVVVSFIFDKEESNIEENKINIVVNYSNFYTVNSCLYRVINYISTDDMDSLLLTINEDYKNKNNINRDNVLTLFKDINNNSTFVSKKMYYQKLNNNITKYYVYGHIQENKIYDDELISNSNYKTVYFIVYLDSANKTFSIEPYSGDIFIGGDNNE